MSLADSMMRWRDVSASEGEDVLSTLYVPAFISEMTH